MKHPFRFIEEKYRKSVFLTLIIWTFTLLVIIQFLNVPLLTAAAPAGIVSHQYAWTEMRAYQILSSWGEQANLYAAFILGLDFLFMISYAFLISLGALLASSRFTGWMSRMGIWISYSIFLAAIFDALENSGQIIQLIQGSFPYSLPFFVGIFACIKFSVLSLGLVYCIAGWLKPRQSMRVF